MRPIISSTAGLALVLWGSCASAWGVSPLDALATAQLRIRRPATQPATPAVPATQPAQGGDSASPPAAGSAAVVPEAPPEPASPPAEGPALRPFGYSGKGFDRSELAPQSDFLPITDRWRIGFPGDYVQNVCGGLHNPYDQNILKGDFPIIGDDKFLVLTATSDTLFEARRTPIPSGVSTARPTSFSFFGDGDTQLINQNFIFTVELFKGTAAYKPRDWELRFTPVANINYVSANEFGVVDPDVQEGRYRNDTWVGIQEAFAEKHLSDLSNQYDFWAIRAGIQGFTSDFRGFLFSDNEPGVRLFGSLDNNRTQWNLAAFHMLEKDTNSGLNSYNAREQQVYIANLYRQDFLWLGYTAQLSFHANIDHKDTELDENGFLARPQAIGTISEKEVRAYYLGWAGDGHIGRLNISHQFYQALGTESFNPIAGQELDINARMFAVELSYDVDWIRYRASFAWSSGDDDPFDDEGSGFDGIFENPNFAGGGFSYWTRQALRLTGSGVGLAGRNTFYPSLRTSKEQGQANFVNPGLFMYNVGADLEITPRVKTILNATYLQFDNAEVLREILFDDKIDENIGFDLSVGVQYRPLLNNNVILTGGAAALLPAGGFKEIYSSEALYSLFFSMTFTY